MGADLAPPPVEEWDRCTLHPERGAVGRCARCDRLVCLECAVPFRGEIVCETDAARELGEPAPPPAPRRRRPSVEQVALLLLALAVLGTIPPWHRSGTLTTALSVWRPSIEPLASLAAASAAGASAIVTGAVLVFRRLPRRTGLGAAGILALLAAVAAAVTLLGAPDFFASTPAPYVFLGSTLGAAAGLLSSVRRGRQ